MVVWSKRCSLQRRHFWRERGVGRTALSGIGLSKHLTATKTAREAPGARRIYATQR
jgi:hypothetical protein